MPSFTRVRLTTTAGKRISIRQPLMSILKSLDRTTRIPGTSPVTLMSMGTATRAKPRKSELAQTRPMVKFVACLALGSDPPYSSGLTVCTWWERPWLHRRFSPLGYGPTTVLMCRVEVCALGALCGPNSVVGVCAEYRISVKEALSHATSSQELRRSGFLNLLADNDVMSAQ